MPGDPDSKTDGNLTVNADRSIFQETDLIPQHGLSDPKKMIFTQVQVSSIKMYPAGQQ